MPRVNPRTVILAALQEGPRIERHMGTILWQHTLLTGRNLADCEVEARLARHLCHLKRAGRVVCLGDGRYALRDKAAQAFLKRVGMGKPQLTVAIEGAAEFIADCERIKDDLRGLAQRVSDT